MNKAKALSIFSLVMINVVAVGSLRNLPLSAIYGSSIIFYYLLAAILFFIPSALVSAELATGWPDKGGLYVWSREAFGPRIAFLVVWIQWVYNIVWYPTILSFLVGTISYIIDPQLANNNMFMVLSVICVFWLCTLVNCFGMKMSGFISTIGTLLGTFIPAIMIIVLGVAWIVMGKPCQITFTMHDLLPSLEKPSNLSFFIGIIFGLLGMEMSAMHADEVRNPQRDFPRALFYSTIIILCFYLFGALAIAIVVPHKDLSLVTGLINAFVIFFQEYHLQGLATAMAIFIIIGAFGSISAWVIGPVKGLLVASNDGYLPHYFKFMNKQGAPTHILIIQAVICSLISCTFLLFKRINDSYWLLNAMTAQLALLGYIALFAAAIVLRYRKPNQPRSFNIPGGKIGLWLTAGLGLITCIGTIIFGFMPPADLQISNIFVYEIILISGSIILITPAIILSAKKKNL